MSYFEPFGVLDPHNKFREPSPIFVFDQSGQSGFFQDLCKY